MTIWSDQTSYPTGQHQCCAEVNVVWKDDVVERKDAPELCAGWFGCVGGLRLHGHREPLAHSSRFAHLCNNEAWNPPHSLAWVTREQPLTALR